MANQELRGRFYISTATSNSLVCNTTACNIPAGYYFTVGQTGETQLLETMQTVLRNVAGQGNTNCYYSATSGACIMAMNQACTFSFSDANVAAALGFATTLTSASLHSSSIPCRWTWRPTRPMTDYPLNPVYSQVWQPRSTTITGRSKDGTVFSVRGNLLYDSTVRWSHLWANEVITPTTGTIYKDYQQWWEDTIHAGQPFRFLADRTLVTTNAYITAYWGGEDDSEVGAFTDLVGRRIQNYNGLWDVEMHMIKNV